MLHAVEVALLESNVRKMHRDTSLFLRERPLLLSLPCSFVMSLSESTNVFNDERLKDVRNDERLFWTLITLTNVFNDERLNDVGNDERLFWTLIVRHYVWKRDIQC